MNPIDAPIDADLCPKCGNSLARHSYFTQQAGVLFMCTPALELPTEPTWGIVVVPHGATKFNWGEFGKWTATEATLTRPYGPPFDRSDILDFIPLTDEQVKRMEAAR